MKRQFILLLTASAHAFGAYTFDYSVTPPQSDPAKLQISGTANYNASSMYLVGAANYLGPIAGTNPNDYEVTSRFAVTNWSNASYVHNLRQSGGNYLQVAFTTSDGGSGGSGQTINCTISVKSQQGGALTLLGSHSYVCSGTWTATQTLRTIVHGNQLLVFINGTISFDIAIPAGTGTPGVASSPYGYTFTVFNLDTVRPACRHP